MSTSSAPSLRQSEQMRAVFSHPNASPLLDVPVWIPSVILDEWAEASVSVANALCEQVRPATASYGLADLSSFSGEPMIDCLSVDFAIVNGPGGLDLSLIELQSFPSVMHHSLLSESIYAPGSLLGGLSWEKRRQLLRNSVQQGLPREQVIMLDHAFAQQRSFMDFFAADADVVPLNLSDLYEKDGQWGYFRDGASRPISAIYNRVIYETLPAAERDLMRRLLSSPSLRWFNHPVNFFSYTKGSMVSFQHPLNPIAVPAQWPLPEGTLLSDWVLKPLHGHSGQGVLLHPDEEQIRAGQLHGDMLQKKINYARCVAMGDGPHPLCAEIRFMLLKNEVGAWVPITTLIRTSWDGNISQSMRLNRAGEGATIACPQREDSRP